MTEAQLQSVVIDLAKLRRWRIHHARAAMRQSGRWSTPIAGHAGFPDLVLLRPPRLLLVELKSSKGRLRSGQELWRAELESVEGVGYRLWRPKEWLDGTVERELT